MQDNPLHHLNSIPSETRARLTLTPSTERLLRDVSPAGVRDEEENRHRRAAFYADLPDRQQAGILMFDERTHDRRRSKALAAALVLMLLLTGAHRLLFGPSHRTIQQRVVSR